VGDPVALVVAATRAQAEDAAERVRIDYEPLASVTSAAAAVLPGSPPVWDECPDNVSNVFAAGDEAATDAAFDRAARVVRRRSVKWVCERREAVPADEHARDNVSEAELALDGEGRFLALRVRTLANVGAYVSSDRNLLATFGNVVTLVGVYTFPAAHVQVLSVLTNTNPTAPYRGAGRPEATYVIERLIADAARELAVDPVELRRTNLIPASAMPCRTPLGVTYDCGEFEKNMDAALKLADVPGFAARREASRRRGLLRG